LIRVPLIMRAPGMLRPHEVATPVEWRVAHG